MSQEHKASTQPAVDETPSQPAGAARRAWRAIGQRKLVAAIVVIVVAAVAVGVSSGSLNGTPQPAGSSAAQGATDGTADGSNLTDAIQTYSSPKPAAAFSLPALGDPGRQVTLSQYAGKSLIVNFWASTCAPCQQETPLLARFYAAHGGKVTMLGIDVADNTAAATAFAKAKGVTYPIAVDSLVGASAANAWDVIALPQTFFLDAQHRVVQRVWGAVTQAQLNQGVALMSSR